MLSVVLKMVSVVLKMLSVVLKMVSGILHEYVRRIAAARHTEMLHRETTTRFPGGPNRNTTRTHLGTEHDTRTST